MNFLAGTPYAKARKKGKRGLMKEKSNYEKEAKRLGLKKKKNDT